MRGEEIAYLDSGNGYASGVSYANINYYPDGTPLIKQWPVGKVTKILLRPRNIQGFMGGIFWIQALLERGHNVEQLILPFVPGSRMDRLGSLGGDYLFTAKSVAEIINSLCLSKVTIIDPHSDVISALIDRCNVIKVDELYTNANVGFYFDQWVKLNRVFNRNYDAVIAPDAGAEKRAKLIANMLGCPVITCSKVRNQQTGEIESIKLMGDKDIQGDITAKLLVVDDICDGGATFLELRKYIKNPITDLYVTHGLFTKGTEELTAAYNRVFCTDSVIKDRPNVNVIKVCEHLLEER